MKDGFIKIATVTPKLFLGDCEKNADNIIENAKAAAKIGAKLIVFPQLSLTGSTLGDLFLQKTLLDGALSSLHRIQEETSQLDAVLVVGLPVAIHNKVYNCAAVLCRGEVCGIVPQFSKNTVFSSAPQEDEKTVWLNTEKLSVPLRYNNIFRCKMLEDFSFGIEIGNDATAVKPVCADLARSGANIIINLSDEPEITGTSQHRKGLCISQSARLKCTYVYVGVPVGESTSDAVYSGACVVAENGQILAENSLYTENNILITDADTGACTAVRRSGFDCKEVTDTYFSLEISQTKIDRRIPADPFYTDDEGCEAILDIQAVGLKRRLDHIKAKTAIIGISGGLDSTLALLVAVRAMDMSERDHKDIIALTMPCFGTSQRTKTNAVRLCEALGVTLRTVDIKNAVLGHFKDISHDPDNVNVVYENAQARERTQILMDIANAENGIVVGTGDLSELALGFATYNGDHMSMYGVNATLPKTLIRRITSHCADTMGGEVGKILRDIVDTPVSPELLPPENGNIAQKTEEIVGAYELHDFFIYYMFTYGFSPKKIYRMACHAFKGAYAEKEILSCLKTLYRRFFAQQYKRSCLPDGAQVTPISFSPRTSWHMPSDACGAVWLKELENIK